MHVALHVSGYISVCVDIDVSCQEVLEKKAPLRQLDLEWKGACLLCWQDTGVSHDRWPEQGREDPHHVWLFRSAHLRATGLIPHTLGWFLLSTLTLCDTMLCDRNATRAEEPGRPPVPTLQRATCLWDLPQDTGVLTYPERGGELFSNTSQCVMCDKLPQQSEKSRESGWGIVICLGLVFLCILLFLLLGPGREFGCRPGFGIFPRAEGFSDWCVRWGSSCMCVCVRGASVRQ